MQTVLIVDDEDGVRFGIRLALEECGYAVIEATNGRVGLTHLSQTTTPLVVLLDLMMPHMSGLALLRELSANPECAARHVFILVSAARAFTSETLARYLPNHCLYALPKPFDIDQLIQVVKQAEREAAGISLTTGIPLDRDAQPGTPAP